MNPFFVGGFEKTALDDRSLVKLMISPRVVGKDTAKLLRTNPNAFTAYGKRIAPFIQKLRNSLGPESDKLSRELGALKVPNAKRHATILTNFLTVAGVGDSKYHSGKALDRYKHYLNKYVAKEAPSLQPATAAAIGLGALTLGAYGLHKMRQKHKRRKK